MYDAITKLNEATANGNIITEKVGAHTRCAFQELHKAIDECKKALLAQRSGIGTSKLTSLQL